MPDIEWLNGNRVRITPPNKPLKLTGTRFAAILGLNKYTTPFKVWCEVTRTYKEPFVDTPFTVAGKTIEPKQAEYMRRKYFWKKLITPADVFGEDYFRKTFGDFFPDTKILGGSWDYLHVDNKGNPTAVLEMKTTYRAEDWGDDIPEYYALQAALYAYLLGVDDVIMVCSFLEKSAKCPHRLPSLTDCDKCSFGKTCDYLAVEDYECSAINTINIPFRVSERYPNFQTDYVDYAIRWWNDHVVTGISPPYDETADAEILKVLRTNSVAPGTDLSALLAEAEELKAKLDAHDTEVAELKQRYELITKAIKCAAMDKFTDGCKAVELTGSTLVWKISRSETTTIDKKALERDGLLDTYAKKTESYRLTTSPK